MKYYLILLLLPLYLFGQDITPNTITIDASTSVSVPAEMITFGITLNSEADSTQQAFVKHLSLEKRLIKIIEQYSVEDSDITYSLMNIRKQKNREGKVTYNTMQTVNITLGDIDKYYDFQASLLTNGFDQFRSRFIVKNETELIEKGYEKAIKNAKAEAKLIADKINRKIGKVSAIILRSHSDDVLEFSSASLRAKRGSLLDINKKVSKRINMKIMFEILN